MLMNKQAYADAWHGFIYVYVKQGHAMHPPSLDERRFQSFWFEALWAFLRVLIHLLMLTTSYLS